MLLFEFQSVFTVPFKTIPSYVSDRWEIYGGQESTNRLKESKMNEQKYLDFFVFSL